MRNLKKLLAAVVVVAMMLTAMVPAFAADTTATVSTDAKACSDIGMLLGAGAGVTPEYTATAPSRIQAAVLFLRLKGLEAEAKAFAGTDNFSDVTAGWEKPYTAYLLANPSLGFAGIGDGKFDPDSKITAAQYYKVVLTALGYAQGTDFEFKDVITFAASKGLTKVAAVETFTVDSLAIATVEGLKAAVKGGTDTLATTLVKAGKLDGAKAEAAGVYTAAPAAKALDVDTASALTSSIVEVTLNEAATAADVAAASFTVKDSAGKAVAVKSAALAAYDSDKETVLVTLEANTTAGTLYTLTVGTVTANFGGKAVDTTKPEISKVESTEYNKVKITFNDAIVFDGATITFAEKYGTKASLAISATEYDGKDAIVLTTADQKKATLYGVTVSGVKDFSGNVMEEDSDFTFVGTEKNADDVTVDGAYGQNVPEEAVVQFNVRVDEATLTAANFKVEEMYGTKAVLPVTAVRIADVDDDLGVNGVTLVDDVKDVKDAAKHVILSIPGVKDATLYKVTVSGVKSIYGKAMSTDSDDTNKTFVGKKKPADAYGYTITGGVAQSNTSIKLKFDNKVVKADAENIANYAIAEAYGSKAALAVTKAELDSDGVTLTLTTAAMKSVLYKLTITGIKDIYGNAIDTDDDANIVSFSGKSVAKAIDGIDSITYDGDSTTVIIVDFNQNVGDSLTDVSHYLVDKDVGYPIKAEAGDNDDQVKLTLPKLTIGTVYKLTVKNLENADGVAMGTDGVSKTFIGKGDAAGLPEVTGVIPVDEQTLKIFFDRDVTDDSIDGAAKIWDEDNYALVAGALKIKGANAYGVAGTKDLDSYTEYAYQDATDKNVLVVRVNSADFKAANAKTDGTMVLDGSLSGKLDGDNDTVAFAPSSTEAENIVIDNVVALDKRTIRVYFNQAVEVANVANFAHVATTAADKDLEKAAFGSGAAELTLAFPTAIDSTKTVYDFQASGDLAAGQNWLVVNRGVTTAAIHDWTENGNAGYVSMDDEDTDTAGVIDQVREFAGTTTAVENIDGGISVMMKDARTMEIYYPEAMDTTSGGGVDVTNKANYTIYKSDKATSAMAQVNITDTDWDETNNKVTLTFDTNLSTSDAYYLQTAATLKNATNNKFVKDSDGNALKIQFANNTDEADKVAVTEATYDAAAGTILITLNMKSRTADEIVAAPATIVDLFDISVVKAGVSYTLVAGDIDGVDAQDADGASVDATPAAGSYLTEQILITLDPATAGALTIDKVGEVTIKTAAKITGIDGMTGDEDVSVPLAQ